MHSHLQFVFFKPYPLVFLHDSIDWFLFISQCVIYDLSVLIIFTSQLLFYAQNNRQRLIVIAWKIHSQSISYDQTPISAGKSRSQLLCERLVGSRKWSFGWPGLVFFLLIPLIEMAWSSASPDRYRKFWLPPTLTHSKAWEKNLDALCPAMIQPLDFATHTRPCLANHALQNWRKKTAGIV